MGEECEKGESSKVGGWETENAHQAKKDWKDGFSYLCTRYLPSWPLVGTLGQVLPILPYLGCSYLPTCIRTYWAALPAKSRADREQRASANVAGHLPLPLTILSSGACVR